MTSCLHDYLWGGDHVIAAVTRPNHLRFTDWPLPTRKMDFEQYTTIVTNSAAESGYDNFLPSLCIVADDIEMNVLDIDPGPNGDETVAKEWASEFTADDRVIYLAYRSGDRTVTVVEITGFNVTQKLGLKMVPYAE